MITKIEISNLKIQAFHGALPQEHIVGNSYSIDLTITTDFSAAMVSDNLEFQVTVSGGDSSYGENLLNAGKAGSTFYSRTHAMQSILSACSNIIDEVGTSKIGKAHNGEDVSYIESPYSYNSITDFYDNITSVENVYYGGVAGRRDESKSLHAYLSDNNPEIDRAVTAALGEALAKIKAMKAPFVLNYTDNSAKEAIQACAELDECIGQAITAIAQ